MAETYTGQFRDGVILFEGPTPALEAGTRVRIVLIEPDDDATPTLVDRLKPIIGAAKGLPPDIAERHRAVRASRPLTRDSNRQRLTL